MDFAILLTVLTIILLLSFLKFHTKCKDNSPPGPGIFSILLNFKRLSTQPYAVFQEWGNIYGPIICLRIFNLKFVILNDLEMAKKCFSDMATAGRLVENPLVQELTRGSYGILNSEGPAWQEQRLFVITTLRQLGFSKGLMENLILDEAQALLEWLQKFIGQPIEGNKIFTAPVINSLWTLLSGERCEWEKGDTEIIQCAHNVIFAFNKISTNGLFFMPQLRHLAPNMLGWNNYVESLSKMNSLVEQTVQKHLAVLSDSDPGNFIDCFLKEIKRSQDPTSSFFKTEGCMLIRKLTVSFYSLKVFVLFMWYIFSDKHLTANVFDLFFGGSETTSNTLAWACLYLSAYQDVQEKLFREIKEQMGTRKPCLEDKTRMPYTQALILELLRIAPFFTLGVPHRMLENLHFNGYMLFKGDGVLINTKGIHSSPEIWGDPQIFRPERFLSNDGTTVERKEGLIGFGTGKRFCIGEALAKDTMFLFLTYIFQEFKIIPENNQVINLECTSGILYTPKDFKFLICSRN